MADTNKRVPQKRLFRTVMLVTLSIVAATVCSKPSQGAGGAGGTGEDSSFVGKPEDGVSGSPESHPRVMVGYAQQLAFGEGIPETDFVDQELDCEPDAKSCDNQATVRIRIVPANHGPEVDWNDVLHPAQGARNGHIVAKVTNMGEAYFAPLNLAKHDVAFLWVGPVGLAGTQRTVALYKLGTLSAKMLAKATDTRICSKPKPTPSVHLFPMLGCEQPYPPAVKQSSIEPFSALISYFVRAVRTSFVHTSGLWVGCSNGCCQVQLTAVQ